MTPAPRARRIKAEAAAAAAAVAKKTHDATILVDVDEQANGGQTIKVGSYQSDNGAVFKDRPKTAIFMKRRSSAGPDGHLENPPVPVKASLDEMRQQLRLGPANRAANPRSNTRSMFKIKQGTGAAHLNAPVGNSRMPQRSVSVADDLLRRTSSDRESTPLLGNASANGAGGEDGYGSGDQRKSNGKKTEDHR